MSDPKHSPVPDARTLAAEHERIGRAAVKIIADYTRTLDAYGEGAFGTLTSGGSEANLIGLKCARDRAVADARDRGLRSSKATGSVVVYASEQCHYSFVKSVDILGIGRENLRKVDTDERFHIRTDLLRRSVERDIAEGHTPVCVAGAAGATSTGVVDPLDELADIASEFGLSFHCDV